MDGHQSLGMRLSSKMFLSSALVILVLTSVSALSLGAVGSLVSVNRETTTHTIPAMSLTASARDAIPRLVALYQEGRLKLGELVSRTYALDKVNDALTALAASDGARGVIRW